MCSSMENVMTDAIDKSQMDQTDYMKIFMQELTYQDPLKPVDNKEFMAQMAQFSALQQATQTTELLEGLSKISSSNQALMLLGKTVVIEDGGEWFTNKIKYENQMLKIEIRNDEGETRDISLGEIIKVYS